MSSTSRPDLQKRKSPVQARSQQRAELIMDATRSLLKEKGLTGVTTTAIAARASIPVGSLYQYYPNKKVILMALYENYLAQVQKIYDNFEQPEYLALGWEEFFDRLLKAIHRAELRDQIEDELEKAMSIYPELMEIDRQHREKTADRLAGILRQLGSRWTRPKLRRMALFLYNLNAGVWSYRSQVHPPAKELLDWELSVSKTALRKCFE